MSTKLRIDDLANDPSPDIAIPDPIYSREYDDLKYIFNRAVETAADASKRFSGAFYALTYMGAPTSAIEVRSMHRRVTALLAKWDSPATQVMVTTAINSMQSRGQTVTSSDVREAVVRVRDFLTTWLPLADKMVAVKDRVVKGRKPSAMPRKTEPRTKDNTGTCACCGQNVKLAVGKIVLHGFTIRPGWRAGRCFGVGFSPIETGPDGLVALLEVLRRRIPRLEAEITNLRALDINATLERTPEQPYRTVRAALSNAESELRHTRSDITATERRIREWVPRPLPTA